MFPTNYQKTQVQTHSRYKNHNVTWFTYPITERCHKMATEPYIGSFKVLIFFNYYFWVGVEVAGEGAKCSL